MSPVPSYDEQLLFFILSIAVKDAQLALCSFDMKQGFAKLPNIDPRAFLVFS